MVRGTGRASLPPRPSRLALRPALALLLAGVFVGACADLAAGDGAGVVAGSWGRARRGFAGPLPNPPHRGEGVRRANRLRRHFAGDRLFRPADGHFVQRVLAEERSSGRARGRAGGLGDVAAHVVQRGFGEEGAAGSQTLPLRGRVGPQVRGGVTV